jgi:hypothetical protein
VDSAIGGSIGDEAAAAPTPTPSTTKPMPKYALPLLQHDNGPSHGGPSHGGPSPGSSTPSHTYSPASQTRALTGASAGASPPPAMAEGAFPFTAPFGPGSIVPPAASPLSPLHLVTGNVTPGRRPFDEQDDDDGFLCVRARVRAREPTRARSRAQRSNPHPPPRRYVLDCSCWVWKAGTCASETVISETSTCNTTDGSEEDRLQSSRSSFPPARARHTATPITDEGVFTILFGGYKTKATMHHHHQDGAYGDHTFTSGIGQPLNDAWSLRAIGDKNSDAVRFIWRRLKNLGAPPSARWGHVAVSIGSGAMVVFGGCEEVVDLTKERSGIASISSALEDCYVFHLGGIVGAVTSYERERRGAAGAACSTANLHR